VTSELSEGGETFLSMKKLHWRHREGQQREGFFAFYFKTDGFSLFSQKQERKEKRNPFEQR